MNCALIDLQRRKYRDDPTQLIARIERATRNHRPVAALRHRLIQAIAVQIRRELRAERRKA